MSELYRDFIDGKADEIINSLGGTITPAPANTELYRDFLDRKFDDVINAIGNVKIKKYEYTGHSTSNATYTHTINLPDNWNTILAFIGYRTDNKTVINNEVTIINDTVFTGFIYPCVVQLSNNSSNRIYPRITINNDGSITLNSSNSAYALDNQAYKYYIIYI